MVVRLGFSLRSSPQFRLPVVRIHRTATSALETNASRGERRNYGPCPDNKQQLLLRNRIRRTTIPPPWGNENTRRTQRWRPKTKFCHNPRKSMGNRTPNRHGEGPRRRTVDFKNNCNNNNNRNKRQTKHRKRMPLEQSIYPSIENCWDTYHG